MRTILAGMTLTALAPGLSVIADAPRPLAPVLVVVAPWSDPAALVEAAGGWLIGPGSAPLAALAASDDPRFAQRLRTAGAWLVSDGTALSRLCGVAT